MDVINLTGTYSQALCRLMHTMLERVGKKFNPTRLMLALSQA